jgi:hypothetical protein
MSSLFLSDRPQPGDVGVHEGNRDFTEGEPPSQSWQQRVLTGIQVGLDLCVQIGKQLDRMDRHYAELNERLQRFTPVDYGLDAAGVVSGTNPLVLALGSPDMGTYWEVESCFVGGTDQNVTAAGSAGLYVAATLPTVSASGALIGHGGTVNISDRAATLPNPAFYGRRDIVVFSQEWLYVVVVGGTAGQQYVANASVSSYNVASARGVDVTVN